MTEKTTESAVEPKPVWDRTPAARYRDDASFRQLVDMLEAYLHNASFTPSELREASLLAAIHFEARKIRYVHGYTMTDETATACWSRIDELFRAIQKDERPLFMR